MSQNRPCPACRALGGDKHGDHLFLMKDGNRWACGRNNVKHPPYFENYHGQPIDPKSMTDIKEVSGGHSFTGDMEKYLPTPNSPPTISEVLKLGAAKIRSIPADIVDYYGVKVEFDVRTGEQIRHFYPITSKGELVTFHCRILPKDFRWLHKRSLLPEHLDLFGTNTINGLPNVVVITEGQIDTMASFYMLSVIKRAMKLRVLSLPSGNNLAVLKQNMHLLSDVPNVIFDPDGDDAGQKLIPELAKLIPRIRIMKKSEKDADEMLNRGKVEEYYDSFKRASTYKPSSIVSSKDPAIKVKAMEPVSYGIPYPFKTLNQMTYGCRPRQLIGIGAGPGCIAGNAIMHVCRIPGKGYRKITMKELYLKFNGIHKNWTVDKPTYLQSKTEDMELRYNVVEAVVESGVKDTMRITTKLGNVLECTYDHPIADHTGFFKRADEFQVGSTIISKGSCRPQNNGGRKKRENRPVVAFKHHPSKSKKLIRSKGRDYWWCVQERARAVVEADMNKMSLDTWKHTLDNCNGNFSGLVFLSLDQEVHHRNGIKTDDRLSNLEVLSKSDHSKKHPLDCNFGNEYLVGDEVVCVEPVGEQMTYDIRMAPPYHNFVCSGLVVHNTGKTVFGQSLAKHMVYYNNMKMGIFALEESPAESLRRMAGHIMGLPLHLPGVRYDPSILEQILDYLSDKLYYYDHAGYRDWQDIEDNMRYMAFDGVAMNLIDPVSALHTHLSTSDVNQFLGMAMYRMSRLIQELNITIFHINHLNNPDRGKDHSEGGDVKASQFTGSRAGWRFSTDIWGLVRDALNPDPVISNTTTLVNLKNRLSGKLGRFQIRFDPQTGIMKEIPLSTSF